jgi:hypothetical protein
MTMVSVALVVAVVVITLILAMTQPSVPALVSAEQVIIGNFIATDFGRDSFALTTSLQRRFPILRTWIPVVMALTTPVTCLSACEERHQRDTFGQLHRQA